MIKAVGKKTIFVSKKHKFRLRVQKDSAVGQAQKAGTTVTVSVLREEIKSNFEGTALQGMLQVKCLQSERRFNAPLLFDFPVGDEDTSTPIMDNYRRVLYAAFMRHIVCLLRP